MMRSRVLWLCLWLTCTLLPSQADCTKTAGRVLGLQPDTMATYACNLTYHKGVRLRDVFEVRRGACAIGEAIVVYVDYAHCLVVPREGSLVLRAGDLLVYRRQLGQHPDRCRGELPTKNDPVEVKERTLTGERVVPALPSLGLPGSVIQTAPYK